MFVLICLAPGAAWASASDRATVEVGALPAAPQVADEEQEEKEEDDQEEQKKDDEAEDEESGDEKPSDADAADGEKDEAKDSDESSEDDDQSSEKKADSGDAEKSSNKEEDSDDAKAEASKEKKSEAEAAKPADEKAEAKKPEEKKPETHKVATKDLKIQVEADAVFVAEEAEEVALRPEAWSTFKVVEAVPHGARVHKGDVLVKFDSKDIDKELADKSLALRMGEIALLQAEEEFPRLEQSIALNYEQAERTYDEAQEEQERFNKTMRGLSEKMAEYMLKSAQQEFENAEEELKQLEKMYQADELTEETEEIVLKRQKFQVEAAKFFLEYSRINHEYTTTISIPRRAESLETAVDMAKIEFERAKMAKSLGMNEQRYQLQQLRETRKKALEDFAKLEADRQLMELKAPADGIAYYGRCVNGRWAEVGSLESKLIPFGVVTPNSVVMTVVKDRPLYVETSIGEKELPTVEKGQPATVTLAAEGDAELDGKVESVGDVPGAGNKFAVRIDADNGDAPDWLMPGMTGKAKITTYDVEDAVVIPAELVQSDEEDPKKKYVMVEVEGEEKPVRRDVKLGKTKDKEVEVLDGLKAGDAIVKGAKEKPEDKESADDAKDAKDDKSAADESAEKSAEEKSESSEKSEDSKKSEKPEEKSEDKDE
ncbi:MAG: hypothetical protein DCC67_06850 [Planctomycetota bacterium]|nr:MAG: hypothetical protein DCC67_06850 [Planctomycetota bacterium]